VSTVEATRGEVAAPPETPDPLGCYRLRRRKLHLGPNETEWVQWGNFGLFLAAQPVRSGPISYDFVYDRRLFSSWFTHVDEHGTRSRMWSGITPGDVVLDVGAGFGSYVLPALAQGAAHVYAMAPKLIGVQESDIPLLLTSLDQNGWRGRCSILPFGLYSKRGWLVAKDFAPPSEFFGPDADSVPAQAMAVTTLDSLDADLLHLDRLDWVKIDVEGAEVHVLRGGIEAIKRLRPKILVENHLFKDAAMEERVAEVLAPIGYEAASKIVSTAPSDSKPFNSHVLWVPR